MGCLLPARIPARPGTTETIDILTRQVSSGYVDEKVRAYLKKLAKRGGRARAEALTPKRRREIARKAIATRWAKHKRIVED